MSKRINAAARPLVRRLALWCGASVASLCAAGGAMAQGVPTVPGQAAGPATASSTLDEIVVTAMKRSETVLDVPASITAVGENQLKARGIVNVDQLQFAVPSLQAGTFRGDNAVTIRGVGLGPGGQGVAQYVDGVYEPNVSLGSLASVDVARIEVLRGPQGTLYGRNANAGAINFISNAPTDQFGGYVQVGAATYSEYTAQGVLNMPIRPGVRSRLVLNYDNRGKGFVDNLPGQADADKGEVISGRLRVDFDLSDSLKFGLNLTGMRQDGPYYYFGLRGPLSGAAIPGLATAQINTGAWRFAGNDPSTDVKKYGMAAGTLTWASTLGDFKSVTAYQDYSEVSRSDDDGTNQPFFPSVNTNDRKTFTEEVNLNSKIGSLDTIVGAFYMHDDHASTTLYHFALGIVGLPPMSYLQNTTPKYLTKTYAAYVDATWHASERLRLIGGIRYSKDDDTVAIHNELGLYNATGALAPFAFTCPAGAAVPGTSPLFETQVSFNSVTGRGGFQYDVAERQNVYGTISQGYKSGGINASTCSGNAYQPEEILSYEAGYKARLFGGRVSLAASAFYYDYTNFQLSQVVGLASVVTNASAATIKGVEVEAGWNPDEHWAVNASASFLDAKYDSYTNRDNIDHPGAFALGGCVAALSTPDSCIQDLAGRRLNNAPRFSSNVGISYRSNKYDWGDLLGRIDIAYRSKTYFREFNQPLDAQDAFTLVNMSLIWTDPSDRYSARLFGNNVTNVPYFVFLATSEQVGRRSVVWGPPRQVGLELTAKF